MLPNISIDLPLGATSTSPAKHKLLRWWPSVTKLWSPTEMVATVPGAPTVTVVGYVLAAVGLVPFVGTDAPGPLNVCALPTPIAAASATMTAIPNEKRDT